MSLNSGDLVEYCGGVSALRGCRGEVLETRVSSRLVRVVFRDRLSRTVVRFVLPHNVKRVGGGAY